MKWHSPKQFMSLVIRNILESDVVPVRDLLEQLGYSDSLEAVLERIRRYQTAPNTGVVVADDAGEVSGFLAWSRQQLFVQDAVRFHIEALVVKKEQRGKGIGRALLQHVETQSPNTLRIVDLTSSRHRAETGAHDFYRKLGYANEGAQAKVYLRKVLPGTKGPEASLPANN